MSRITLAEQVTAVETEFVNLRGSIEILEGLVQSHKRDETELRIKKVRLMNLEAALKTMKWLQANEARIKLSLAKGLAP